MKLSLRSRDPTDEERLQEIVDTLEWCGQEVTPIAILEQFHHETKRYPEDHAVAKAMKNR